MPEEIIINGMKCKPFNLERALAGDAVVTMHGRSVSEIKHFKGINQEAYPVFGVVDGCLKSWSIQGMHSLPARSSNFDLYMAPVTKVMYQYIYRIPPEGEIITGHLYETIEEADKGSNAFGRIALATVTWEE